MSDIYDDAEIQFDGGPPAWGERLTAPDAGADYALPRGLAVHPSGRYVAMAHDTSPYLEIWTFDPDAMVWSDQLDDPSTLPSSSSINGVAWHPDGMHVAVIGLSTTGANVFIYAFDPSGGEVGTQTDTATTNTAISGAAFSPCGEFLALADDGGGKIFDFDPSTGELGTERESEAISGEPTHAVAWSHGFEYGAGSDEVYVAWAHDKKHPSVQYVTAFAFDRSSKVLGSELVPASQPSGAASESARGVSWRHDDLALAATIAAGGSNELFVWGFNPVAAAVGSQYSQATTGDEAEDIAWLPDGRSVATTHSDSSSELLLWPVDYIAEAIDEPIVLTSGGPSGDARAISVSGGSGAIAFVFVSHEASPYLEAWPVIQNLTFDGAHVTLSGSFVPGAIEADIVAGGRELIATVEGDLWLKAIVDDTDVTDDVIAGISGSLTGSGTWDDEVSIGYGDVAWLSPTQLKITLPAASGYSVSEAETISVVAPASALSRSNADVVAKPSLRVLVDELAQARDDSHIILQTARHMIWQTTELSYRFFVDSEGDVAFRRTIDAGATWQPPEKITSGADVVAFDLYYERWSEEYAPNRVHLLWGDATSHRFEAQVVTFVDVYDPELNAVAPTVILGGVELVDEVASITQGTTTIQAACSIVKRPKNRAPVAVYHGTQSGNQGVRRRFIDGSWGTLYAPPSPFSAADIHQMVLWPLEQDEPTTSGDLALIYWDTAGGIGVVGYDNSSDSWSSAVTIQASAFDQLSDRNSWASGYRIRDGHVFLTYWEWNAQVYEEDAALRFAEISGPASAPTIEQRAPVVGAESYGALCALSIDQTTTHVYVAYGRSTENPRGYDKLDVFSKVYQSGVDATVDMWSEDDADDPNTAPPSTPTAANPLEFEVSDQGSQLDASILISDPGSSRSGRFVPIWVASNNQFGSDVATAHEINTGVALHHPIEELASPAGAVVTSVDKSWICQTSGETHFVESWVYSTSTKNQNSGPSHSVDINDRGSANSEIGHDASFRASAVGGLVTALVTSNTGDACGDPDYGGKKLNIDLYRDGRRVGAVVYRHLESGTLGSGEVHPGEVIGKVTGDTGPCYGTAHIHMDWRAIAGANNGTSTIDVRWAETDGVVLDEMDVVGTVIPVEPAAHPAFKPPPVAVEVLTSC